MEGKEKGKEIVDETAIGFLPLPKKAEQVFPCIRDVPF